MIARELSVLVALCPVGTVRLRIGDSRGRPVTKPVTGKAAVRPEDNARGHSRA